MKGIILDQALWVSWCDVPVADGDAYCSWLHGTYIPKLLKHPGILWAAHYANTSVPPASFLQHAAASSVPAGNEFILLVGGGTALAFSKGVAACFSRGPSRFDADLSVEDKKMLSLREQERTNLFVDAARTEGPAADQRVGLTSAPCIQLGSYCASIEDEDEILAWYAEWRMPSMHKLPGCMRTRKLASVSGWAKHGVLYEYASLADRNKYHPTHEDHDPEMKAWSIKVVKKFLHAPGSPNVAERIWPPVN